MNINTQFSFKISNSIVFDYLFGSFCEDGKYQYSTPVELTP